MLLVELLSECRRTKIEHYRKGQAGKQNHAKDLLIHVQSCLFGNLALLRDHAKQTYVRSHQSEDDEDLHDRAHGGQGSNYLSPVNPGDEDGCTHGKNRLPDAGRKDDQGTAKDFLKGLVRKLLADLFTNLFNDFVDHQFTISSSPRQHLSKTKAQIYSVHVRVL